MSTWVTRPRPGLPAMPRLPRLLGGSGGPRCGRPAAWAPMSSPRRQDAATATRLQEPGAEPLASGPPRQGPADPPGAQGRTR